MVGVLFSNVIDSKVINEEGENDGIGGVLPERRASGNRGKTKMGEVSFESSVGDAAGLFEAGHAFSDLQVDPAFGTERAEAVLVDNFVRDACQGEFHVLVLGHGGAIIELFDI